MENDNFFLYGFEGAPCTQSCVREIETNRTCLIAIFMVFSQLSHSQRSTLGHTRSRNLGNSEDSRLQTTGLRCTSCLGRLPSQLEAPPIGGPADFDFLIAFTQPKESQDSGASLYSIHCIRFACTFLKNTEKWWFCLHFLESTENILVSLAFL